MCQPSDYEIILCDTSDYASDGLELASRLNQMYEIEINSKTLQHLFNVTSTLILGLLCLQSANWLSGAVNHLFS